jgi:iron complex outermembrane recepter protein
MGGQPVKHRETVFRTTRVGAAVTAILSAALAHGQDAESSSPASVATIQEITVTGSRIRRTTDFDTANPTTVVDAQYIQNLGLVNVGDVVKQLPSNLSNNTPRTTGNANFFIGSTIANLRGLNPFFGSRTLNLVNNKRFVPTNQGDGVDLNFFPSIMIDRIDIITGGASAAYGSGAISGVQNIFLSRRLEGGKAQLDYGQSGESDGEDKHAGFAYGHSLFGERGHFVVGYEYQDTQEVGCIDARDWCREGNGFYSNTPGLNPVTNPQFLLGKDVRVNQGPVHPARPVC